MLSVLSQYNCSLTSLQKRRAAVPSSEQGSSSEAFDSDDLREDVASVTSAEGDNEETWNGLNVNNVKTHAEQGRNGTVPKKPPTGEELRTIKDAADLYMSSSFKLKVRYISINLITRRSLLFPPD